MTPGGHLRKSSLGRDVPERDPDRSTLAQVVRRRAARLRNPRRRRPPAIARRAARRRAREATLWQPIEEDRRQRYLNAVNPQWPDRMVRAHSDAAISRVVVVWAASRSGDSVPGRLSPALKSTKMRVTAGGSYHDIS